MALTHQIRNPLLKPSEKPKPTIDQLRAEIEKPHRPLTETERSVPDPEWEKPSPNAKLRNPHGKQQVTLRIDADIVAHFKSQGRFWQTRLNDALAAYIRKRPR